jgi:hypothetical protein
MRKQKSLHEKWHSQAALICTNEHRSGSIEYGSALRPPMGPTSAVT